MSEWVLGAQVVDDFIGGDALGQRQQVLIQPEICQLSLCVCQTAQAGTVCI